MNLDIEANADVTAATMPVGTNDGSNDHGRDQETLSRNGCRKTHRATEARHRPLAKAVAGR
jgi:hypothetical protein